MTIQFQITRFSDYIIKLPIIFTYIKWPMIGLKDTNWYKTPRFGPEHFQLLTQPVFLVLNKFKTLLSLISLFLMAVFTIMFHSIGIQPTAQAIV